MARGTQQHPYGAAGNRKTKGVSSVYPVNGQIGFLRQHGNLAGISLLADAFDSANSPGPAADDDDSFRRPGSTRNVGQAPARLERGVVAAHIDGAITLADFEGTEVIEGRGILHSAVGGVEASSMPIDIVIPQTPMPKMVRKERTMGKLCGRHQK